MNSHASTSPGKNIGFNTFPDPTCKFQPSWLINSHLTSPNSALLYIHNQGLTSVQNYLDAVQSCQDSHNLLAKLDSKETINQALELMSRINSSLKGFWIDAYTKEHFQDLDIHASGHMQDSCLVLLNECQYILFDITYCVCFEIKSVK